MGVAFLFVVLGSLFTQVLRANHGSFAYPLDDPYIHLAMAKNLARSGVFGVTADGFSSSTSSPLWTLGLAFLFLLTGAHELTPLIVNVALAVAVLVVVDRTIASRAGPAWRVAVLVAVVLLTPIPALVFCGMEHVLQLLLTVLFVQRATVWLGEDEARPPARLLALAALLTATRYEGVFLVAGVSLLSLLRSRSRASAALGAAGALPIAIYGVFSRLHGSMLVPNSVVLKGHLPHFGTLDDALHALGYRAVDQLLDTPHLAGLVVVALAVYAVRARHQRFWAPLQLSIVLLFSTTMLHMQYASTGWFFRYEAYLVGLSLLVLAEAACDIPGSLPKLALAAAALLGLAPALLRRAEESLVQVPQASRNIHDQQVQIGRFVARYYAGERVAANDIGALDFSGTFTCSTSWGSRASTWRA